MTIRFEWDETKALSNLRKHGVAFDDAVAVFADPFAVMRQDRIEGSELRWQTLGMVGGHLVLLVAHTVMQAPDSIEIIRIFLPEPLTARSENAMKTKIIKKEIDLQNLPPLTDAQRQRLDALAKLPDSEIDYSDIPPLGADFWQNAVRNPFYKPVKQVTTVRVDADVLLWLKSRGKGYQTRINAILRQAMLQSMQRPDGGVKADGAM